MRATFPRSPTGPLENSAIIPNKVVTGASCMVAVKDPGTVSRINTGLHRPPPS